MHDVKEFCQAIMRGVINTGIITDDNQIEAVQVMREEAKAFFTGEKYEAQRECVLNGTLSDGYIIADIVTECVARLTK